MKHALLILVVLLSLLPLVGQTDSKSQRLQVTIGAGDELYTIPMSLNFKNSLYETLYLESEINTTGVITALSFYNHFITSVPPESVRVWLGITDLQDLSQGWIPSTDLTLVFDGMMSYPIGENTITLGLNTPFTYNGGTLVMLVQRPFDIDNYHSYDYFKCQTVGNNRARSVVNDSTVYDPANPPAPVWPQLSGKFPQTTLHFADTSGPEMFIQPALIDFSQVLINTQANLVLNIYNVGLAPMVINDLNISGSPWFTLLSVPALPCTLNSGQWVSLVVHYLPEQTGVHLATVSMTSNSSPSVQIIPITGSGVDPTIYNLPYTQNFDLAIPPNLPLDWSYYVEPAGSFSFVRTFADAEAPSQPNLVRLMNSDQPQGFIYLISPPLAETIPVNSLEVTFQAQAYGTIQPCSVSVGVLDDPTDPLSYTEVQYIDITTSDWTEYTVQFFGYQGTGKYIAFLHPQEGSYVSLKIDNITIDLLANSDLAATALTGNAFPCVGSLSEYAVTVANHGNGMQEDYQVRLLDEYGTVLGAVDGVAVEHGESVQVSVPWTPQSVGVNRLQGQVLLTGDTISANDLSPLEYVTVLAAGTSSVTIGTGAEQARIPADFYRLNSLFETVFRPMEINLTGLITGVQFYNNFLTSAPITKRLRIWLGETAWNDLSAGWIGAGSLQLVWDGDLTFNHGSSIVPIWFSEPYEYQGGSLVLLVNRFWDNEIFSSSDAFLSQSYGGTRSRNYVSDTLPLSPFDPPSSTLAQLSGQFPYSSFFIQSGSAVTEQILSPAMDVSIAPNPFHDHCSIGFDLKEPSSLTVEVFDLRGRKILTLFAGNKQAGVYSLSWDGNDSQGKPMPSGVYFLWLRTGKQQSVKKLVLLQ